MWVEGNPGVGTSTLMRHAVRSFESNRKAGETLVSFYCYGGGEPIQKSVEGLFRSLLHQLLKVLPNDMLQVVQAFKEVPQGPKKWSTNELQQLL